MHILHIFSLSTAFMMVLYICCPLLQEVPILLEEQRNKTESCYYLFEIGTSAVCPKQPLITIGLSVGSALLIV